MVPHWCPILVGGRGGGHVCGSLRSRGGRLSIAAVSLIRVSWGVWAVAYHLSGHGESQRVGVTRMSGDGSAEGGKHVAREGCMCCSCFLPRVYGG